MEDYSHNRLIRKTQKYMEEKHIADSFKHIKSLDTIDLSGYWNEGERILSLELEKIYGEDALNHSDGYHILHPFIEEGVIKTTTKRDEIFYTYFCVTHVSEETFDLLIEEYNLYDGNFYFRNVIEARGLAIQSYSENIPFQELYYGCIQDFLINNISKDELMNHFTQYEYQAISKFAKMEEEESENRAITIFKQVIGTFRSLNFWLERNSKERKKIDSAQYPDVYMKIQHNQDNDTNAVKKKKKIALGEIAVIKVSEKERHIDSEEEKVLNRHTNAWNVSGHLRHYKSGKVIFIQPYSKGPERNKEKAPKRVYEVLQ